MKHELGLSLEELEKRTSKDCLVTKKMLDVDAIEFEALKDGDKTALAYLVKAARIIEKINMELDSSHNLSFKKFLEESIKKGDKRAQLTKILFDAQKGIFALDCESNLIKLAKGLEKLPQRGFYPDDLSKEEFHNILISMLKDNRKEAVKQILCQRTVVIRDKKNSKNLIAVDYVDIFLKISKKLPSCCFVPVVYQQMLILMNI